MAWHRPGDKPLSEPMMVSLPTHICVTRTQWVNVTNYLEMQNQFIYIYIYLCIYPKTIKARQGSASWT